MIIQLNGESCQTKATTLSQLLKQFDYGDAVVATALNGDFIAEGQRVDTPINEGDQIEILAPMQGG
ncbi:MAG: thiamine biosynthesis protein ThiS [Methylophaga sp.]|nr:MAG: thiamine biosynthesis protein ThiS [Methylophaga sp.]